MVNPWSTQGSSNNGAGRSKDSAMIFMVHFKALLAKRAKYGMRDKKSLFFQLIVPTLLFLFGLVLLRGRSERRSTAGLWTLEACGRRL